MPLNSTFHKLNLRQRSWVLFLSTSKGNLITPRSQVIHKCSLREHLVKSGKLFWISENQQPTLDKASLTERETELILKVIVILRVHRGEQKVSRSWKRKSNHNLLYQEISSISREWEVQLLTKDPTQFQDLYWRKKVKRDSWEKLNKVPNLAKERRLISPCSMITSTSEVNLQKLISPKWNISSQWNKIIWILKSLHLSSNDKTSSEKKN